MSEQATPNDSEWTVDTESPEFQRLRNEVAERFYRNIVSLQVMFDRRLEGIQDVPPDHVESTESDESKECEG